MMRFVLMITINTIIALVYLLLHQLDFRKKKDRQLHRKDIFIKAAVMFGCPVVAPAIFFMAYLVQKTVYRKPVDLGDIIFSKDRVKTYTYADEEQERNLVPLEDAIAITDTDNLRNLMMTVVRGDIRQSLAAISMALVSDDSETSHYAAAVLQEALDNFRGMVQKAHQDILEDTDSKIPYALEIFDSMDPVLRQKVFTGLEQESMTKLMDEIGDLIYEHAPRAMSSVEMENVTMRLLEMDDYDNCRKWCERQDYHFPEELATYTCALKLYFNTGQKRKFFRVLEELRRSDIVVDSETLELIRVFM